MEGALHGLGNTRRAGPDDDDDDDNERGGLDLLSGAAELSAMLRGGIEALNDELGLDVAAFVPVVASRQEQQDTEGQGGEGAKPGPNEALSTGALAGIIAGAMAAGVLLGVLMAVALCRTRRPDRSSPAAAAAAQLELGAKPVVVKGHPIGVGVGWGWEQKSGRRSPDEPS